MCFAYALKENKKVCENYWEKFSISIELFGPRTMLNLLPGLVVSSSKNSLLLLFITLSITKKCGDVKGFS
jgi:hypothetical protein